MHFLQLNDFTIQIILFALPLSHEVIFIMKSGHIFFFVRMIFCITPVLRIFTRTIYFGLIFFYE